MNIFKRVFLSIGTSVDSFAEKIENQEAVAEGIIAEVEEAVVSVRAELIKMRNEISRVEKQIQVQEKEKTTWIDRAKRSAESDREKALNCARFVKQCETRLNDLTSELVEIRKVERELLANLTEGEQRLNELKRKKRILASRQTRADATNYARSAGGSLFGDAEDLFSRWEAKVGKSEGLSDTGSTESELMAMEFASEEEQEELNDLLDTILIENNSN